MTWKLFQKLDKQERRVFLKNLSLYLASPLIPLPLKYACNEWVGGETYAQGQVNNQPTFFLEVNFRDQWDFGTCFVPPSIAANYDNLSRDGNNGVALEARPESGGVGNFFLTPEGLPLKEHLSDIAVMELGELVIGNIHGHEASNCLRSPGRSRETGAGRKDMASFDARPGGRVGGNEIHYSSSPTPAVLHNYQMKLMDAAVNNGALLRSSIRAGTHTFYHFEANLENAQLDRFYDKDSFLRRFNQIQTNVNPTLTTHKELILDMISRIDNNYLTNLASDHPTKSEHVNSLTELKSKANEKPTIDLALTPEERAFWTNGIPGQFTCAGDQAANCVPQEGTMNLGEMFAYVAKLFTNNVVKTAAIDFDFHDIHTARTSLILNTQGIQTASPLARLIQTLKQAGIWNQTVIAMYTTDGSRSPLRNSTGYQTKNSVIFAGGKVKGGYYGDIQVTGSNVQYHRPDDLGNPVSNGASGAQNRVPAKDIYATLAKLLNIKELPYPDAVEATILNYMLK
ncbi:MAG: DUF1501 domain-containing protein [Oligoflexales bacterium]